MGLHIITRDTVVNQVDTMGTVGDPINPITGQLPAGAPGTTLMATASWTPTAMAAGGTATKTVTVTGAQIGDKVSLNCSPALPSGFNAAGHITAANTVTIYSQNITAATIDPGTVTVTVVVLPANQVGRNDGSV